MRREFDLPITAITGPATDNEVGQVYITDRPRPAGAQRAAGRARACWRWCGRRSPSGPEQDGADARDGDASPVAAPTVLAPSPALGAMKVAVIGAAGYAGGELLRLLLQHPEVTECVATSRSQAGKPIAEVHPALAAAHRRPLLGRHARRGRARAGRGLPLPRARRVLAGGGRGVRRRPGPGRGPRGRLPGARSPALRAVLRRRTPRPSCSPASPTAWPTSLGCRLRGRHGDRRARAASPRRRSSRSIRWPGPGSTSTPSLFAVTGSSGAGVQPRPTTHHPDAGPQPLRLLGAGPPARGGGAAVVARMGGPARRDGPAHDPLGPVRARHLPHAARVPPPGMRHHAAASRGPRRRGWFREAYAGRPFVRVLDAPPELTHAVGTNYALIHAAESENGEEIQVTVAIDNLVKGAGGQAIQAMNLALGIDERAGLDGRGDLSMLRDATRRRSRATPSALLPVYAADAGPPGARATAPGWWTRTASEWLDAYGGHAVASTGHSHPDVVRAIAEQAAQLLFYSTAVPLPQREALAEKLAELLSRRRSGGCSSATRARRPTRTRCTWPGGTPAGRRSSRCAAAGTAAPPRRSPAPTAPRYEEAARRARHPAQPEGAVRRRRRARRGGGRHRRRGAGRAGAGVRRRARLLARVPRGRPPRCATSAGRCCSSTRCSAASAAAARSAPPRRSA